MLLSISTTHRPATDLGYLLGKHPGRLQTFELAYGNAHVFYPEATEAQCTACLLLDIDPIGLVRNHRGGDDSTLARYVNDRPYVASSFMSVAIARVFASALGGTSRERPELVGASLPLVVEIAAVPSRGGEAFLRSLFEPLGYEVETERMLLDDQFPDWGFSPYLRVTLRRTAPLAEVLGHIYVLLPVLDNYKHYWVGEAELEKLLEHGAGWLGAHPARDEIVRRYLKHQRRLTRAALERLLDGELDEEEEVISKVSLNDARLSAVCGELEAAGARSVIDLGCGEGRLLSRLARAKQITRLVGVDVSPRALEIASERLEDKRVTLVQGSLTYRDARFAGFDAACLVEVIEHIEPSRLGAFERVVFEHARPATVIVTTPNAEYNVKYELSGMRHRDHRFEWTRAEFEAWASGVAERHGYAVRFVGIGELDDQLGAATQMGVFSR
jgi:3' terminal RNA ribose 2'-O-methyltransferase Hen1